MLSTQSKNDDAHCSGIANFKNQFSFDPAKSLFVGMERECFITDQDGKIVPMAERVLARAGTQDYGPCDQRLDWNLDERFTYELSACQVESRIGPCRISDLTRQLYCANGSLIGSYVRRASYDGYLDVIEGPSRNLGVSYAEVAPADMPLDVYPDPTGRYAKITVAMPREVLLAACRVIGTHVHIGMPDHETALAVYNRVVPHCGILCEEGDGSKGERLRIYRVVAPDCDPKPYQDWEHFHRVALERGFAEDPRKCWTLIRISKHGTIEFRMFGASASIEKVAQWAERCHTLCLKAMP